MKKFLCLIIAVLLFAGCGKKQAAIVNGAIIYEAEILDSMKDVNKDTIERLGKENVKQNLLDGLVERQLLLGKIAEDKYAESDSIKKIWKPYEKDLTYKYFINTYLPEKHPISKKILQAEYDKKKDYFKKSEEVHARHILIKTGPGGHSDKDAFDKITSIQARLKKDGSNFAEIAKESSECPSAKEGGDLKFFGRDQMVKPFEEAAFALKKGQMTDKPVKTQFGYHLIYAEDVKEASFTPLEEVKQYFMPEIYANNLKEEYGIVVYSDNEKSKNEYIAEIKKTGLKYSAKDFRADIESLMGKAAADELLAKNKDISKPVQDLLFQKAIDDKIIKDGMDKDEKFKQFMQKSYNELITSSYLDNVVFKDIKVSDQEVRTIYKNNFPKEILAQQFGEKFLNDAAYRMKLENEMIYPNIKSKILEKKKGDIYYALIDELKKKSKVEIKIKYKTT